MSTRHCPMWRLPSFVDWITVSDPYHPGHEQAVYLYLLCEPGSELECTKDGVWSEYQSNTVCKVPLTYLPKSWASAALAADAHTPPTCQHTIHFSRHGCQVRKMSDELSLTNIFTCHFPDKDRAPTSLEGLGEGKYCRHWSDNCFSERCASMTTVLMLNLSRRAEPCHYLVSINTVTMTFAKRWWNPKDPNTRKVWNERFVTVQDKAV